MLGSTGSLFGGLLYLDDTDVQFVAGRCLVRYDTETRIQTIIQSSHTAAGITAVAVTPNKRYVTAGGSLSGAHRAPQRSNFSARGALF